MEINNNTQKVLYTVNGHEVVDKETKTSSAFANDLEKSRQASKEEKKIDQDTKAEEKRTEKLLEDIMFLFKTGMTKEDFEKLQEMIDQIKKKIQDGNYDEKEVANFIEDLEKQIMQLKKSLTGEAIKEVSNSLSNISDKMSSSSEGLSSIENLSSRVENILNQLSNIEKGQEKSGLDGSTSNEELMLIQKLKQETV